jgi:hypothetical protein
MSCHWFDASAFAPVPSSQTRFGTSGRNILRGPGYFNLDASVFRDFRITERVKFQFRMEICGVTNTPHFSTPGYTVTNSATPRVPTSTFRQAGSSMPGSGG